MASREAFEDTSHFDTGIFKRRTATAHRAYCRQAGAKATAQAAYRGAVMAFEQALMALQHLPESRDHLEQAIDLRLDLRHVSAKGSSSRPFRAMDMTFWLPQVEAALAQVEGA